MASPRFSDSVASATAASVIFDTTGAQEDDLLIAMVYVISTSTVTTPSGWMRILQGNGGGATDQYWFARYASSSEATSVTVDVSASSECGGYLVCLQDVHPRWVFQPASTDINWGTSTTATTGVAKTLAAGSGYVLAMFTRSGAWANAISPPSGMTEVYEADGMYIAEQTGVSAGSTGTKSISLGTSTAWAATLLAVEDVGAAIPHPAIRSVVTSNGGTSLGGGGTALALPPESVSGDLVIYVVANDATGGSSIAGSTGWTAGTLQGTTGMEGQVFARVLTGTTGDNILSITGAAEDYLAPGLRIRDGDHGVTSGNIATWMTSYVATASSIGANANPPSLTPPSSADYLWIAAVAVDTTAAGANVDCPTTFRVAYRAQSAASATSVAVTVAQRQLTAGTTDPSAFGSPNTVWHAWTMAVPPAGVVASSVISATAAMVAPSVTAAVTATPTVISATASMLDPTITDPTVRPPTTAITATAAMEQPLVLGQGTSIATRTFITLSDYIATLDPTTTADSDRVVLLSEQTGDLTTLGMDELEGWVDPDPGQPPGGWPEGSWGGGGPGGFTGGGDPPDWGTDPWVPPPGGGDPGGGGSIVPDPPPWEPPPPDGDGEIAPDPGHDGELQDLSEAYVRWDARQWSGDPETVLMSGTAATGLQTDDYEVPGETPTYVVGSGDLVWSSPFYDGSQLSGYHARLWHNGVLGGIPYGLPFTYVWAVRPRSEDDALELAAIPESVAHMELGGTVSAAATLVVRDAGGGRRCYVRATHANATIDYPELPILTSDQHHVYDLAADPLLSRNFTSVVVATVRYPVGGILFWINGEPQTTPIEIETNPVSHPGPWPAEIDDGGSDIFFWNASLCPYFDEGPTAQDSHPYGIVAMAMYRGQPNANDLAVLQWRYGH